MSDNSFFEELKKRKVVQVAAIYGAVAWGVTEIVVTIVEQLFLPAWVSTLAVIAFVVGFPIAMFLSWTFDITPDGIQRTSVTSRRGRASIVIATVLLLAGTAGLFLLINPAERRPPIGDIAPNSVAVLPFENVSGDSDDDYLVNGLSDELRDQLGRVEGLQIAARSSSVAAKERVLDAMTASRQLGVAMLVEGSVRRRGNDLIVSVQLVDGNSGLSRWSDSFDRSPRELLAVQQSIASQIIGVLLPESADPSTLTATQIGSANELLLLARHYEQQLRDKPEVDPDLMARATGLYRQATEADPESALAFSRLAGMLMYAGDYENAEGPIFKALTLEPNSSEVQNTVGTYRLYTGQGGAGSAYQRAVELNPNNADALADYAYSLWMSRRMIDALPNYRRAFELDPLNLSRAAAYGEYLAHYAMVDEALEMAQTIQETFAGAAAYAQIARIHELTGNVDQAIAWAIRARDADPGNPDRIHYLAELYADIGDINTATELTPNPEENVGLLLILRQYDEFIDLAEFEVIERPDDLELVYWLAFAYTANGRPEDAIRFLSAYGLPESALGEVKDARDMEAFSTLINALELLGEEEIAKQLIRPYMAREHSVNDNYWVQLYSACPMAIMGQDQMALARIGRIGDSPRLPWDFLVRDMPCLLKYEDEPVYLEMLDKLDRRRAELRERLPLTLAEFGVAL